MRTVTTLVVALLVISATTVACAQATWEGPTGVFLNPLALNLAQGKVAASVHYLNLQRGGDNRFVEPDDIPAQVVLVHLAKHMPLLVQ